MKKIFCFTLLLFLLMATSCETSGEKARKERLEIYSNDSNYITVTGRVLETGQFGPREALVISCEEMSEYTPTEEDQYTYLVFSDSALNIEVGHTITYTTVKICYKDAVWLPIVAVSKDGESLLNFEDGKANLLEWADGVYMK